MYCNRYVTIIFFCILVVFSGNSVGYTQSSRDSSSVKEKSDAKPPEIPLVRMTPGYTDHSYYGTRTNLFLSGSIITSLGLLIEIGAFVGLVVTPLNDTSLQSLYTNMGLLDILFISGGTLVTAGTSAILAGIMYIDDAVDNRATWRKNQLIIGIAETFVGAALTTTGGILLGMSKDEASVITNKVLIGTGSATASMGIVSTLVGIFAP